MKYIILLAYLLYFSVSAKAQTSKAMEPELKKKISLACRLTDKNQIKRMNELHKTLFKKVSGFKEHSQSYELVFEGSNDTIIGELAEFIKFERQCCPWLAFHLTFEPDEGAISLTMGNSDETKQMVYLVMELEKLSIDQSR